MARGRLRSRCPTPRPRRPSAAASPHVLPPGGVVVFLEGDLGAGKTTLVRGILRGLGHEGPVKSPTYTLVEPYELGDRHCAHLDLYRLADPEELEYLGLRDLLAEERLLLVEWPERGAGACRRRICVIIEYVGEGREISLDGLSERGRALVEACAPALEGVSNKPFVSLT